MKLIEKVAEILRSPDHQVAAANICDNEYCRSTGGTHAPFTFESNEASVRFNQVALIAASEYADMIAMGIGRTETPSDEDLATALNILASADFYTDPGNYRAAANFTHAVWMGLQLGRGSDRMQKPYYTMTALLDPSVVDLDIIQIRAGARYLVKELGLSSSIDSKAA